MQECSVREITIIREIIKKSRTFISKLSTNNNTNENGTISQRKKFKNITRRVSNTKKKILGQHFWNPEYFCRSVGTFAQKIIKAHIEDQIKNNKVYNKKDNNSCRIINDIEELENNSFNYELDKYVFNDEIYNQFIKVF